MKKLFLGTCIAVVSMVIVQSCSPFDGIDEIEVDSAEGAYAIPLVNTTLSIEDLLEKFEDESTLTIDPDGLIRFHYSGDVLTKTANQVFAAINQTLNQTGAIPLINRRQALPFTAPGGLEFDRMDIETGEIRWKERLPGASKSWGSLVLVGQSIYTLSQTGETVVFEANPERLKVLAQSSVGEQTNSSLVPSEEGMLIRTHQALWCIGKNEPTK